MRKLFLVCALCLTLASACESETYKPSVPSVTPGPTPTVTKLKDNLLKGVRYAGALGLADPFIFVDRTDSVYYIFGTSTPAKGFKAYASPDLERWVLMSGKAAEGFALHKNDVAVSSGGTWYSDKDFWAPELYKVGNIYLMYYSAAEHVYVAEASSPLGPFKQSTLGFTPNAKGIDNSIFIDEDGKAYMYWVRFDGGNVIYCAEMEEGLRAIKTSTLKFCFRATQSWELLQGKINEGPAVFKHNGLYYMVYSGNHFECQGYGVGVATAPSPTGPWTKYADNPILCKPGSLVGTGHCSVFTDLDGKMKMVFHAHASTSAVAPRQTYVTDLSFENVNGVDKLVASPSYTQMSLYQR